MTLLAYVAILCAYLGPTLIALVAYDELVAYSKHDYRNLMVLGNGVGLACAIAAAALLGAFS